MGWVSYVLTMVASVSLAPLAHFRWFANAPAHHKVTHPRKMLQETFKALNLWKQELCQFCPEAERMSPEWLPGTKAALPIPKGLIRSFPCSLRNLMSLHSPLCLVPSLPRRRTKESTADDEGILPPRFFLLFSLLTLAPHLVKHIFLPMIKQKLSLQWRTAGV